MDNRKSKVEEDETVYKPLTYEITEPQLLTRDGKVKQTDSLFLFLSSITANFLLFDCGCNFTWTSPAASTLRSSDPNINPLGAPTTPFQESWLAAIINLGAALGPLIFGKFADVIGRKKLLIAITVSKIISYIVLAFAENIYFFYLGRFLLGLGMGLSFAIMPMYTGEISQDHNRGKFVSIMGVFITLGTLYTLGVGPLLPLKAFTLSCMAFLIIPLIGFASFLPETPIYLVSKEKNADAKKVLMKLNNMDSLSAEKEVTLLIKAKDEESSNKVKATDIWSTPSLRKAFIITVALFCSQHFSGIFPIMAFMGPIFETTGSKIPTNLSVLLVSVVQLIAAIFSSLLIERLGRKPLLLASTIGTFVTLSSLGTYFYLKETESQYIESIFWLPVLSLVVYIIAFSIGLTSVPLAIASEVFPSNVRSVAISIATFFGAFTGAVVTFIFPIVMVFLGGAKCFWLFAGLTLLCINFIYFVVPETKGKSISEIQKILSRTKK